MGRETRETQLPLWCPGQVRPESARQRTGRSVVPVDPRFGPDWERGDEDGGEGFVGTVVAGERADGAEEGRHDVATVQWDVRRERHSYRCGAQGKYDLRVLDSAPAGQWYR